MRGNPDLIPIENLWQVVYSETQKAWEIISNSVCKHLVNLCNTDVKQQLITRVLQQIINSFQ